MPPVVKTPNVPITFVKAKEGEVISLGSVKLRVMEDGSRTDNRISSCELILPPKTPGPPAHWHEMHDESFLVTKGTVTFHVQAAEGLEAATIHAKTGDYVVVPTRAPHTFSNESDEEARFFNTFTPAFYIHYFKLLSSLIAEGKEMTPEVNEQAMAFVRLVSILNQLFEMELGAVSRAIGTPKAPRLVSKSSQAPTPHRTTTRSIY